MYRPGAGGPDDASNGLRVSQPSEAACPKLTPNNDASFVVCVIPSDPAETRKPKAAIMELVAAHGYSDDDTFALKLALEEALSNAVKHGNCNDPSKEITIRYAVDDEKGRRVRA